MNLLLKKPICFIDLETTGLSITQDRIIEIGIIKIFPDGKEQIINQRINPTIPISKKSILIHGIKDEDVAHMPSFKEVAKEYIKILHGSDLGGYNILKFDLPILVEEFLRAELDFEYYSKKIIDCQRIFYLMEKRTLSAAYRFYCKKELKQSHSAIHDARATSEILQAQLSRYENQDVTDHLGNKIGVIQNDINHVSALTNTNTVDLAGRMIKNEYGETIFNFGKHKNKSVLKVLEEEPSYYNWILNGDFPQDTKRRLTELRLTTKK